MSEFDLGLSKPHFTLGGTLLLVGVTMFTGSFVLESNVSGVVAHVGQVLFGAGLVVHVMGRLAKACGSPARSS